MGNVCWRNCRAGEKSILVVFLSHSISIAPVAVMQEMDSLIWFHQHPQEGGGGPGGTVLARCWQDFRRSTLFDFRKQELFNSQMKNVPACVLKALVRNEETRAHFCSFRMCCRTYERSVV